MRRHTSGIAHLSACGCRSCTADLQSQFASIIRGTWNMDDLMGLVELEKLLTAEPPVSPAVKAVKGVKNKKRGTA